jgi:two-component system, NtrC family, sensor kinase
MASFFVIRGRDNGQHFGIRGSKTMLGRESSNDIKLNDTEVSRQHAAIVRTDENQFEIRDLESSNGTHVNGKRITQQRLHSGDRVQLGRTLMIFTGGPDPHSTQSLDGVEIVSPSNADRPVEVVDDPAIELSQIRHSVDSHYAAAAMVTLTTPDDSPSAPGTTEHPIQSTADSPANPNALEIVYQVSQAIRRTGDLHELLTQVLDLIFQWIACDRGCIMMLDDVTGQLTPTYSRGRANRSTRQAAKLAISRTILDYVTSRQEGVLTSNAQDDSRWQSIESISDLGIYEAMCVPMLGRYGLVGAIYVDTQISAGRYIERRGEPCFTEEHLKLMIAIAGQAALAIEDTQFYRAMLQSERLATMGQTIANLSHHVKNILQGVSGGAYLLQDGLKREDIEVIRRGWKIIERNQERISNLVMDMLSFSKERQAELREGDIGQLLQDVFDLMHSRASEMRVELSLRPTTTRLTGMLDSEAMHRAVLNVVTNAIDAAAAAHLRRSEEAEPIAVIPEARVELWCEQQVEPSQLLIVVQDNGDGIAEDDQKRIFSPFESSKGARGTGLGLPVSQKILREHGGEIVIDSTPGMGSRFKLQWPHRPNPPDA